MTPAPSSNKRVLLVDDHPMFREHLTLLISREMGMEVCGEADSLQDALLLAQKLVPDIAVVDITLRSSNGLDLIKKIRQLNLSIPVLVLSMHDEENYAERALRAGACGYVSKSEASGTMVEALRCVLNGQIYVSRKMNTQLLHQLVTSVTSSELSGLSKLADRELEVFRLLGQGRSTAQVAQELQLGESTIETYRARIKDKLGLRSAAELYLRAGRWVRENS
jgi:DNA-binding NarL/FixJ family response regulator